MKLNTITYELNDVTIVQAPVAYTTHRSDVNNKVNICNREVYPIFVAPMASITNEFNYKTWIDNGLTPVVPRSVGQRLSFEERMEIAKETFVSISLLEATIEMREYLEKNYVDKLYICIDIAHGTLYEVYQDCQIIKTLNSNVEIMAGNICNPDCYAYYADAGIDWIRVGIGGGSRCTTSANVGIHYGMATLLDRLNEARKAYAHSHNGKTPTKIIADGGISNFDCINKSIALGADAVMCGKLIAQSEEACEHPYYIDSNKNKFYYDSDNDAFVNINFSNISIKCLDPAKYQDYGLKHCRDYYGMSTKRAQCETGGSGCTTSEGISRPVEVLYPIVKWVDNMQAYLRSCMTYTNSRTIEELQKNAQLVICSDQQFRK